MDRDIAAYYNQTQNHYKRWWQLDKAMALHYGLWHEDTRSFTQALQNTNIYMAGLAKIKPGEEVLDAGCGVGGSALYLAVEKKANVTGISLSELQIETAKQNVLNAGCDHSVRFELQDYCETGFESASFDVIWACESSSSASDKTKMLKEWTRLLKPGGRLIILDFFRAEITDNKNTWLEDWAQLWAMSPLVTVKNMKTEINSAGLEVATIEDLNLHVAPTVKRMYLSYLFGRLPSKVYNIIFGAQKYSKNHYKSGYYQYKAYHSGEWKYAAFLAIKP